MSELRRAAAVGNTAAEFVFSAIGVAAALFVVASNALVAFVASAAILAFDTRAIEELLLLLILLPSLLLVI